MGALLLALAPLLAGITQPIKDYFSYKQQVVQKEQDYKLALLQSQVDIAKSADIAASTDLKERLNSTSQSFKQSTFWLMLVPLAIQLTFPRHAEVMWHNFTLMPEWYQWLFLSVYSSVWGIPLAKNGYAAATQLLNSRREYKLEKARINRDAVFKSLRAEPQFKGRGIDQNTVDMIGRAIDAGENTLE